MEAMSAEASSARGCCFNGAALIRARKCSGDRRDHAPWNCASMGPRSFERGNAASSARRRRSAMTMLQWGRARSSAEMMPQLARRALLVDVASMGPRSFERGNQRITARMPRDDEASMGPRSFERGNAGVRQASARRIRPQLQWGRAHSSAEISSAVRSSALRGDAALQWGRAHSSAEMSGDR